jgi:hypothetical protein
LTVVLVLVLLLVLDHSRLVWITHRWWSSSIGVRNGIGVWIHVHVHVHIRIHGHWTLTVPRGLLLKMLWMLLVHLWTWPDTLHGLLNRATRFVLDFLRHFMGRLDFE